MAPRKKKKIDELDMPSELCLFTKKEIAYILQTAKMFRWPISLQDAAIYCTPDEVAECEDNLSVRHLCNQFAFIVQTVIELPAAETKVFDPELKQKRESVYVKEEIFCEVGDTFKNVAIGLKMKVVEIKAPVAKKHPRTGADIKDDETVMLQELGAATFPKPISMSTIREMVRRRAWVKL